MNTAELIQRWEKVLTKSGRDTMDHVKITTWFKPLNPIRIDMGEGIIYFTCDENNDLLSSMVKMNYNVVSDAIKEEFGKAYDLTIVDTTYVAEPEPFEKSDPIYENKHFTFDSFISGSNNRIALACSVAVAEKITPGYNPLFIYGRSGLGKTHLLVAIARYVKEHNPNVKVLYTTTENFTNELVSAIRTSETDKFRRKYRSIDLLLLDDIQFIAGKTSTEEEIFNTFNELYMYNKEMVISSDKPPQELKNLPDRLITRFAQGMTVDIQPPDFETRAAILQQRVTEKGIGLTPEINEMLNLIAQNVTSDIRNLEGALKKVLISAEISGSELNSAYAKKVLGTMIPMENKEITPGRIKRVISEYFGVKISDLEGTKRTRDIVYPRQIAIYLMRKHTDRSFDQIGGEFGGKDHSTVMHSYDKIEKEMQKNKDLKAEIEKIEAQLTN